jgi:hypothetical protein
MSALWWIPLVVAAVSALPLYLVTKKVAQELVALQASIASLRRLRPAVVEVQSEVERTRRALANKRLQ